MISQYKKIFKLTEKVYLEKNTEEYLGICICGEDFVNTYKKQFNFLEDIGDIPKWVWEELKRYNQTAGKILSKDIISYFQEYLPKNSITVYRGMGFTLSEAPSILKKLKIKKPEIGQKGIYQTSKIQSWTLDKNTAKEFAGKFLLGGVQDKDSLGIILEIKSLDPSSISIPIAFLPRKEVEKYIPFWQEEVLLNPGRYEVVIQSLIGNWSDASQKDITKDIKQAAIKYGTLFKAEVSKTWNKEPGFSLQFPQYKILRSGSRGGSSKDKYWMPSIELHIDGYKVYLELFYGQKKSHLVNQKEKDFITTRIIFKSVKEISDYLQSKELENRFQKAYRIIQSLYSKGGS